MLQDVRHAIRTLTGVSIGVLCAFITSRLLEDLLFGVTANDPATFATSCVMLTGILLVAAYMPARRATRVDPLVALRAE